MLARIAAAFALLVLLAGCVVSGPADLVSDREAATPLPDFTFYPYSERDGAYALSDDDPMQFTVVGNRYEAGDGKMVVRFVPLEASTYMIVVVGEEKEAIFGTATLEDEVMSLRVVLDTGLTEDVLAALGSIPAGMEADDGGIHVANRAALDFAITGLRDGRIPASPLIGWIGKGDAKPPARIVPSGDRFVVAN